MDNNLIKCEYCGKQYSHKGIGTHIWRKHGDGINHKPDPNIGYKNGTRIVWNKGLNKENNESVNKFSQTLKTKYDSGELIAGMKNKKHTSDAINKMKQYGGGIRKSAGRGKSGWYKGYWCDSSWELAYVIYNLDHNIKFERNKQGFEYIYKNETHKYYPDFILEDGTYVEIKGYETELTEIKKQRLCNEKYIIINRDKMKPYLEYTKNKYGKDFIKLYNAD